MGRYLDRLKKSENGGTPYLQNLQNHTSNSFVGFVGTPAPAFQEKTTPRHAPAEIEPLTVARAAYFTHKYTCPICSQSWAATANCEEHGELWLAYHDALVTVHGVELVDGPPELSPEPPAIESAPKGTNGYRTVVTAHIMPMAWIVARDAYYKHWFTCQQCKPNKVCDDGAKLQAIYNQQEPPPEFIT